MPILSRLSLAAILFAAAAPVASAVAPPHVSVSADKATVSIGDPITFSLVVQYDTTLNLIPPPVSRSLGGFDVLGDTVAAHDRVEGEVKRYERRLRLAAFRPGGFWIPSLAGQLVGHQGELVNWMSDSLAINVASVLAEAGADTADIKGLKGPYEAPVSTWYWWLIPIVAVLLGALYLWRRHGRTIFAVKALPPVPPWETALVELSRLRQEINPETDGGRLWYFRLSEILRRYWDGRYGWQSIDQTTTEIVRQLSQAPFNGEHRVRAEEFLHLADRVRYAKQPAREGRPEVDWHWVQSFVNETTLRLSPDQSPLEAKKTAEAMTP